MPPPPLDLQNMDPLDYDNIVAGLGDLTNERNLPQQFMNGVMTNTKKSLEFLKKPQEATDGLVENARKLLDVLKKPNVRAVLLSAGISFTAIFAFCASFGFNLAGIGAGSLAAAFQTPLTPAGGLFATLQSMGMLGTLLPVQIGVAGVGAVAVSGIVWLLRRGRE
ncbi:hypothetical protein BDR22DRAFT_891725 [Usnea florida]